MPLCHKKYALTLKKNYPQYRKVDKKDETFFFNKFEIKQMKQDFFSIIKKKENSQSKSIGKMVALLKSDFR